MMMELAETTAAGLDPMTVGTMIGGILLTLLGGGVIGKKISDARVTVANNPLDVDVREKFVTRQECLACKSDMRSDVREMKVLYDKAVTLIMERDEKTSAQIRELGDRTSAKFQEMETEGAERRRRIHDKLNTHADKLASIDARTEVSKSIGRLGSAIMTLAKKEPN